MARSCAPKPDRPHGNAQGLPAQRAWRDTAVIDPRTAMVCIALMYVVLSVNTWVYLDETKRTSVRIWRWR